MRQHRQQHTDVNDPFYDPRIFYRVPEIEYKIKQYIRDKDSLHDTQNQPQRVIIPRVMLIPDIDSETCQTRDSRDNGDNRQQPYSDPYPSGEPPTEFIKAIPCESAPIVDNASFHAFITTIRPFWINCYLTMSFKL